MKLAGALLLAAVAVAAVLSVPCAAAQASPTGVTLTIGQQAAPIPYMGTGTLPVAVDVGCADILSAMAANQGSAPLTITAADAPAWLSITGNTIDMADANNIQPCLSNQARIVKPLDLTLAVTKDAPGVVDNVVNFTATLGDSSDGPKGGVVVVAYHVNYTLKPDAAFPFAVTTPTATFNLTATQASNARSMIMMEEVKESCGLVSGLASTVYESSAAQPASKTFKVTFTAPDGEWTSCKVEFKAYGHYLLLDSRAGPFDAGTPVSWEFTNGGVASTSTEPKGKDSPAPVAPFLALGLVALAALMRRHP